MKCSYCCERGVKMWRPLKNTHCDFKYCCAKCLVENYAKEINKGARNQYLNDCGGDFNTNEWVIAFVRELNEEEWQFLYKGWWYDVLRNYLKIIPAMNRQKFPFHRTNIPLKK